MKNTVTLAPLLCVAFGCGADLTGRTTLAEAHEICSVAYEEDISGAEWDLLIAYYEGLSEISSRGEAMVAVANTCAEVPGEDVEACLMCQTAIVDAVWP